MYSRKDAVATMPNADPYQQQPVEFEEWLDPDRSLPWARILAVLLVLSLIAGVNAYLLNPKLHRRIDYYVLRAQAYLKKPQPHDPYIPTPASYVPSAQEIFDASKTLSSSTHRAVVLPTPTRALALSTPAQALSPTTVAVSSTTPAPSSTPLPAAVRLNAPGYEAQGWNNCGPATLAMVLRFYGWAGDQDAIAKATKPDKDDRNVSPHEMVAYAFSLGDMFGALGYATDTEVLKLLLSNGFPVIIETWFIPEPDDQMGHYRLLTGYDDAAGQFVTQDAYRGPNQPLPYSEMEPLWKVFNRVYVVICEASRTQELRDLLGDTLDPETMYRRALSVAVEEATANPEDRYAWFNVGTNYVGLKQYEEAAAAYDRARMLNLPWRMLWYQFGPFEAYLGTGRYRDVMDLTNANLRATPNLEESYYYRALAQAALGNQASAREDLQSALRRNPNFRAAAEALRE
jgi:hypothetical protein